MGTTIAKLVAQIGADTSGLDKGLSESENKLQGFSKSGLNSLVDFGLKAGAALAGATAAIFAFKQVFDFGEEAAAIDRLQIASGNLANSMGADMDQIVAKIRQASLGTVSDYDIMASASKAMMLGVSADADELANLMEVAALRGRAMGLSTTQAFDDIVRGIGRMSPQIIDNLGIIMDAENTYKNYADSIGKSASELTALEKRQALLNRVLDEGNAQLKKVGGLSEDAASGFERLKANVKNLGDEVKTGLLPYLSDALNMFNDLVFGQKESIIHFRTEEMEIRNSASTYSEYIRQMEDVAAGRDLVLYKGNLLTEQNRALVESNVVATESEWKLAQVEAELNKEMEMRANVANYAIERQTLLNEQMALSREEAVLYSQQLTNQISQGVMDIENLRLSMEQWKMNAGDQMVQYLGKYIPESSELYRQGLQVVDEVTGTAHGATYDLNAQLQDMALEFRNTKDTDAFKTRLRDLMNKEMEQFQEKVKTMQNSLQGLYDMLSKLAKTWAIDVVMNFRGGGSTTSIGGLTQSGNWLGTYAATTGGKDGGRQLGGSVFANQSFLVGERGPELFRSFRSGWIDSQPARSRGEDQSQNLYFYFQDTTLDEVQMRDVLRRAERLSYS